MRNRVREQRTMTSIRNPRLRMPLLLLTNGAAFAAADATGGKGGAAVAAGTGLAGSGAQI
ncbi:MAG: hypothetical protein ABSA03_01735 [Streptosporangiaceae bacterium]